MAEGFNASCHKILRKIEVDFPLFICTPPLKAILDYNMSDITKVKPLWSEFSYKPHQITAVEWMVNRESMVPSGGILCDEMGLGKTIEVLGLIKSSKVSNTLIIAPVAVLDQWASTAIKSSITVMRPKSSNMHQSWEVEGPTNFMESKCHDR